MRKILAVIVLFGSVVFCRAQVWHDAASMHVFGKAVGETYSHYVRFPEDIDSIARKPLRNLGKDAAGLYVQFRTDSPSVHVRWTSVKKHTMSHMASVGSRGLDIYSMTPGGWLYAGSARPALDYNETTCCILKDMDAGFREFRIYLSLYDGIGKLEIGIDPGFEFIPEDAGKRAAPVVMYGSSILQGGCVSRPGMASTNILGRWLGREVVNLGFSGNARLDPEIAELMARVGDPAVFVIDNVPNCTANLIREKGETFVRILRAAYPAVPIVFVEMAHYSQDFLSSKSYGEVESRNAAQRELYGKLKAAGDGNLYYVDATGLIGSDGEALVDNVHQTDLGQLRYAEKLYPVLKALCEGGE